VLSFGAKIVDSPSTDGLCFFVTLASFATFFDHFDRQFVKH
jgi:hypothetical protein